jgi:predicted acyl esterase
MNAINSASDDLVVEPHVMVRMRDGVRLRTDVDRPGADDGIPC